MTTDSTGFRSLVEQIQQRDLQSVPQRPVRERSRKTAAPSDDREERREGERSPRATARTREAIGFLGRRWL